MNRAKPYTKFEDERRGFWTNVDIQEECISFTSSRPKGHWTTTVATICIISLLLAGAVQSPIGIAFILAVTAIVAWHWHTMPTVDQRMQLPIIIGKGTHEGMPEHGRFYHVHQIRKFVLRENANRDTSEDSHLIQIYLELRETEKLVLLYQDYFSKERVAETEEIFGKLKTWLKNAK